MYLIGGNQNAKVYDGKGFFLKIYRHKLNMLSCVIPELDEGNICPACPKTDGVIFESLDALFIGRRKKAGQSIGKPLFEQLMFYDQTHVDQFVANYTTPTSNKECHGFCAGNAVRSMNRYRALDETAIFGRGCRHEFPKKFLNLKHGERLSYAVYVLQELEKDNADKPAFKINILYDVACMLVKHLQVKFSPRRKEGFGLTDGEMLERLWAYIRKFSRMTKEMRPSHRVDVLSDALLHYGKKTKINLGNLLMARMKRAVDVEETAKSDIEKLCRCFPSHRISIDDIREWMKDESTFFGREVETEEEDWKCKYVIYLDLYADLYHRWNGCTDPSELTVRFNQMKKIDEQLKIMERENSISARWQNTDSEYENAKRKVAILQREKLSNFRIIYISIIMSLKTLLHCK
ncbi:uncharacterized protein LOC124458102 isoform X3 [Xenia sp. Carnegie-2017]|uniref:uncharacterized protein LOC124458102 isoform X3 n=1 Tax=Xenia sp. Carnegie-2017 TaxID=2897299 RepID=UPI001F046C0B|nr:uncharacterized protein LOC124458102 isoform X3 [Xenia sp. Carnegie-2017]